VVGSQINLDCFCNILWVVDQQNSRSAHERLPTAIGLLSISLLSATLPYYGRPSILRSFSIRFSLRSFSL
jgi:hypothetical protein